MNKEILEIVCVVAGIFTIVCAGFNWDFFMNNPSIKGSFFFKLLGIKDNREKQRIFYIVMSVILILAALVLHFMY